MYSVWWKLKDAATKMSDQSGKSYVKKKEGNMYIYIYKSLWVTEQVLHPLTHTHAHLYTNIFFFSVCLLILFSSLPHHHLLSSSLFLILYTSLPLFILPVRSYIFFLFLFLTFCTVSLDQNFIKLPLKSAILNENEKQASGLPYYHSFTCIIYLVFCLIKTDKTALLLYLRHWNTKVQA